MINNRILTYDDIKRVKEGDLSEKLVDVRNYDVSITAQYEKFDMVAYAGLEILVRDAVAEKLAAVNQQLKAKYNLTLKVVYGYRALEVQTNYFNTRWAELGRTNPGLVPERLIALTHNFVAVPTVAGHVTGGAIDVTLIDSNGAACDMGTKIADYADESRIRTFCSEITANQRQLRQILLDEMVAEGFAPFLGEWWHFSYGDKEWAAYYEKSKALYGPVVMNKTAKVMKIAGGNETVLQAIRYDRGEGVKDQMGRGLLSTYPTAEQAGLLYVDDKKLEMAGGEFCGNASAAAAVLLTNESTESKVRYRVSGFEGEVIAEVSLVDRDKYHVRTSFIGMNCKVKDLIYRGKRLKIVDMKGIVHILIEDEFPTTNYESMQRKLIDNLNLRDCEAVGVIWYERRVEGIRINPVVWVRKVNTLYYESACGSGAIAAALCTDSRRIFQPTGECISVYVSREKVTTECEVTIITE